jgi:hypothetical protein
VPDQTFSWIFPSFWTRLYVSLRTSQLWWLYLYCDTSLTVLLIFHTSVHTSGKQDISIAWSLVPELTLTIFGPAVFNIFQNMQHQRHVWMSEKWMMGFSAHFTIPWFNFETTEIHNLLTIQSLSRRMLGVIIALH